MTKLTLRKAAAVQNEIRNAIKELALVGTVSVNEFTANVQAALDKRHGEAWDVVNRREQLNTVLFNIRSAVGAANHNSGISEMLAKIGQLEAQIKDLESATKFTARGDLAEVNARLEKHRSAKEDRYSVYSDGRAVEVGVFTEDEVAGFKAKLADVKRQRQGLRDKILEANIRSEITVADEDEIVLHREGVL
jgi:hypothetical protein